MSLDQFLGLSYEIKIIDFLMSSYDFMDKTYYSYSIDEIQDSTGIDTGIILYLLPKLEYNGLIEYEEDKIKLAENHITHCLLNAVFSNGMLISSYPEGVQETNFLKWKSETIEK